MAGRIKRGDPKELNKVRITPPSCPVHDTYLIYESETGMWECGLLSCRETVAPTIDNNAGTSVHTGDLEFIVDCSSLRTYVRVNRQQLLDVSDYATQHKEVDGAMAVTFVFQKYLRINQ